MRATMTITWLLLSLSFLFRSVCSNDGNIPASVKTVSSEPITAPTPANGTNPSDDNKVQTENNVTIPPDNGGQENSSTLTPELRDNVVSTKMTIAPMLAPNPQPQATSVTINVPAQTPGTTGAPSTVTNSTTPALTATPPMTTPSAATSGSNSSTDYATTQTPETSSSNKTSQITSSTTPTESTKITMNNTNDDNDKSDQQSMPSTTFTPSKMEVTETSPSHKQTATSTPGPTESTGTTSTPSTLTSAEHPAAATAAGTMSSQTTTSTTTTPTIEALPTKMFSYSLNNGQEKGDEKHLVEVCRRMMGNFQDGNCTLTWRQHNGKVQFDRVEINGKVKNALAAQYYEEITKTPTDNKTLIAILASCGALLIMIVILAVCASHHRKPYNENQQHLTEELHTVENGYHDNPTLEVMEVQPEMQEKKVALNGEFNDSWIVPIDNLLKEDIPDEEDTHL